MRAAGGICRPGGAQFGAVVDREVAQDGRAHRREADDDAAAVGIVPLPLHEALPGGAVDQFDGAVVVQQQAIREVADGHGLIVGEAARPGGVGVAAAPTRPRAPPVR